MFMKLVEFIVTFLTIRRIIEEVKDETVRTETDSGRGGDQHIPGDLHKHPESVREDGKNTNPN
jgi:hypothetical protein